MEGELTIEDIRSADGHRVQAHVQAPAGFSGGSVLLLTPAMGVESRYYRALIAALSALGHAVVAPGLRGGEGSSVTVGPGRDFGYRELLQQDWPAYVAFARARFGDGPLFLVGHSLGGQLNCLHQARATGEQRARAMVMLACCSAHHAGYAPSRKGLVLAGTQLAAAIAVALGHYPGHRLGFGGRQPTSIMRDWAREARLGRYVIEDDPMDYRALLAALDTPALSISFEGDSYAPPRAVDALCARLAPGSVDRVHLDGAEIGVATPGHFRWVSGAPAVAERVHGWLERHLR